MTKELIELILAGVGLEPIEPEPKQDENAKPKKQ